MDAIVFDTETTGFRPGNICQLAYIKVDGPQVSGVNMYFNVSYVEPGAQRIHGLSAEKLGALSGGLRFGDRAAQISADFSAHGLWIAHNYKFDCSFLQAEYHRIGAPAPKPTIPFCTMNYYTPIIKLPPARHKAGPQDFAQQYKYPRLDELIEFIGITEDEIIDCARGVFPAGPDDIKQHDARFDCAATYLCYKKGAAAGYGPDGD